MVATGHPWQTVAVLRRRRLLISTIASPYESVQKREVSPNIVRLFEPTSLCSVHRLQQPYWARVFRRQCCALAPFKGKEPCPQSPHPGLAIDCSRCFRRPISACCSPTWRPCRWTSERIWKCPICEL